MSPGMLCDLLRVHNMKGYECKNMPGYRLFFLIENMNGGKGQTGEGFRV
jgi:hypothetical protein